MEIKIETILLNLTLGIIDWLILIQEQDAIFVGNYLLVTTLTSFSRKMEVTFVVTAGKSIVSRSSKKMNNI